MKYKNGTKIYIVDDLRSGKSATGQQGIYKGTRKNIVSGVEIPVLVLDSGEVLYGNECVWKALDNNRLLNEERQQKELQVVGKTKTKTRAKNRSFLHYKKQRSR